MATSTRPALAVQASRLIDAPPDRLYALLSDVTTMGSRSPEARDAVWLSGGGEVGSRFKGSNRIKAMRWTTVATVTVADPGRRFAFVTSAPSRSTWTYELSPQRGGTLVTESVVKHDAQPLPIRWLQRLAGVTDRAASLRHGIESTLERLAAAVEA